MKQQQQQQQRNVFQGWNMKNLKLIVFEASNLLQSLAFILKRIKSVSSLFVLNSNDWSEGVIGTSPNGPFKTQNLISNDDDDDDDEDDDDDDEEDDDDEDVLLELDELFNFDLSISW